MKICFIAASNTIHSYKWIKYFYESGYEIVWISTTPTLFKIPKGIHLVQLNPINNIIDLLRAIITSRREIVNFAPDLLHVHYVGINGLLALFSGVNSIVATAWGSDVIQGKLFFWRRLIIKKILSRARLVTCDAFHMRDELMKLGISKERIKIINFGVDTQHFSYKNVDNINLNYLRTTNKLNVISLRDYEPIYDIENLISSMPLVLTEVPNVQFILLGRGTLKNHIRSLVKDMHLDNSVVFLDYIDNAEMPNIMSIADVLVSTSLADAGIAGSTAEAMSCELPVVVSDSGENSRWINSGENGFLVKVSDPNELAQKIILLLQNNTLLSPSIMRGH